MVLSESTKKKMAWGSGVGFAFMALSALYFPIPYIGGFGSIFGTIALGLGTLVGGPIPAILLLFILPKLLSSFIGLFTGERSGFNLLKGAVKSTAIAIAVAGVVFAAAYFLLLPVLLPMVLPAAAAAAIASSLMAASIVVGAIAFLAAVYIKGIRNGGPFAELWGNITDNKLRTAEVMIGLGSTVAGATTLVVTTALSFSPLAPFIFIAIGLVAFSGIGSDTYGAFKGNGSSKPEDIDMSNLGSAKTPDFSPPPSPPPIKKPAEDSVSHPAAKAEEKAKDLSVVDPGASATL